MIKALFAVGMVALAFNPDALRAQNLETATFAGGCFWCVESDFDKVPGVVATVSGYTGGAVDEPSYRQVASGGTGHREAVQITFDRDLVTFEELLTVFWRSIDPVDSGGQFCDRGEPYMTAVFVKNEEERQIAEASKQAASEELGEPIVAPILEAGPFYRAEEYHQDYYQKNPKRYRFYRWRCGRDGRVEDVWGDNAYKGIPDHD